MDELDLTDADKKATYHEIKEYVMAHYGYKIPSRCIAQMRIPDRQNAPELILIGSIW